MVKFYSIDEARRALRHWGQYQNAPVAGSTCRGYPSQSCVLSDGIDRHRKYAPIVHTPSALVEKVIDAMKYLEKHEPVEYMALKYKYEENFIDADAAKQMNMSRRTFQTRVLCGEKFIAGKIS